jgi:hypothetical protein
MKFSRLLLIMLMVPGVVAAQSNTTDALHKKHSDALAFFFYNNTLRMLNQKEDAEFDALIKDIQKMKFLMIDKKEHNFGSADYKNLLSNYKGEAFEEIMTSRYEGKNFDVYLKESDGKTKGMLVLINDSTNLYVLDILGSIALDKVTKLYSTLDESADIGKKIKAFASDDDDESDGSDNHGDDNHDNESGNDNDKKKSDKNH